MGIVGGGIVSSMETFVNYFKALVHVGRARLAMLAKRACCVRGSANAHWIHCDTFYSLTHYVRVVEALMGFKV